MSLRNNNFMHCLLQFIFTKKELFTQTPHLTMAGFIPIETGFVTLALLTQIANAVMSLYRLY